MSLTQDEFMVPTGAPTASGQEVATVSGLSVADIRETVRKTLTPSMVSLYLPVATPYTTGVITAGVPYKTNASLTAKDSNDFSYDAINERFYLNAPGVTNRKFSINSNTSMTASTNNTVVTIEYYINGAFDEGVSSSRKVSTGSDVGSIGLSGTFSLSHNDYIEVFITLDNTGTVTLSRTAIVVIESN